MKLRKFLHFMKPITLVISEITYFIVLNSTICYRYVELIIKFTIETISNNSGKYLQNYYNIILKLAKSKKT